MKQRPQQPTDVDNINVTERDLSAALDAETTHRQVQRAAIVAALAEAERRRDAAQAAREAVALAALAEGDADAQQQRRDPLAAYGAAGETLPPASALRKSRP